VDLDDKGLAVKTEGALAGLRNLGAQRPVPSVDLDDRLLKGKEAGALAGLRNLAAQRPVPVSSMTDGTTPIVGHALRYISMLHGQRPRPYMSATDAATPVIQHVLNRINSLPASRTTTLTTIYREIRQTYLQNVPFFGRSGGEVGRLPRKTIRRSIGGPVFGEGGPTEDKVRMMTTGGDDLLVSPQEWIIRALSATGYGSAKMAAVNAGRADIVLPGDPRYQGGIRRADGGPVSTQSVSTASGGVTINGGLTVKIETPMNLYSSRDLDRAAYMLRERLVKIERADR
jgi:hypothetical protein